MYSEYDPFDYMYSRENSNGSVGDPVYAAVTKSDQYSSSGGTSIGTAPQSPQGPPPLPPRNSAAWSTIERRRSSMDRRVF